MRKSILALSLLGTLGVSSLALANKAPDFWPPPKPPTTTTAPTTEPVSPRAAAVPGTLVGAGLVVAGMGAFGGVYIAGRGGRR